MTVPVGEGQRDIFEPVVHVRRRAGELVNGKWVQGAEVRRSVFAVFSPVSTVRNEPGRRSVERIVGVRVEDAAKVTLRGLGDAPSVGTANTGPDLLRRGDETWVVHSVTAWNNRENTAEVVAYLDKGRASDSFTPPAGSISPSSEVVQRNVEELVAEGSLLPRAQVFAGRQSYTPELRGLRAIVLRVSEANLSRPATSFASQAEDQYTLDSVTYASIRSFWQIDWMGAGALDSCQRFRLWIRSPAGMDACARRGLTYERVGQSRELTGLVQDDWEPRAGVDLGLEYVQFFRFTTPAMRIIPTTVKVLADDSTASYTSEVDAGGQRPTPLPTT